MTTRDRSVPRGAPRGARANGSQRASRSTTSIGGASLEDETGESRAPTTTSADTATETYDREIDDGLEENAEQLLCEIDAALARIEEGTYGTCAVCGKPIAAERLEALPWATLCIDDARKLAVDGAGSARTPARPDVRVGSSTNALRRSRSPSARSEPGASQWLGLGAVAVAAVRRRPADEARRRQDALARRGGPRRRAVLDPPRPELRDRVRALLRRDLGRDRAHGGRRRLDARLLRALRRAASRAAGRARPRDRRQRLEPRRPGPARPRDGLPRPPLLARVQPRRQLHRVGVAISSARSPRRRPGDARPRRVGRRSAFASLTTRRARLDRVRSRPARGRLAGAAERAARRRRRPRRRRSAGQEPPAGGRRGASVELPARGAARSRRRTLDAADRLRGRAPARRRQAGGLVVHPGAGHATGTLVHGLLDARRRGRRRGRPARDRPPSRPRHVRAARRRPLARRRTGGSQKLVRARGARARVPRARPRARRARARGRIEAPIGRDRTRPNRGTRSTPTTRATP